MSEKHSIGLGLLRWFQHGAIDHRRYVEHEEVYDIGAASIFRILTDLGLRERHQFLDIGCGPLRAGRLFIPYLGKGCYHGIEPQKWLLDAGIRTDVGRDLIRIKKPRFSSTADFEASLFNKKFDFILAHAIFCHASKQQIQRCLREVRRVMTKESIFAASFLEGKHDYEFNAWMYPWTVSYRFSWLKRAAKEAGLTCVKLPIEHHYHQTWVAFTRSDSALKIPKLHSRLSL